MTTTPVIKNNTKTRAKDMNEFRPKLFKIVTVFIVMSKFMKHFFDANNALRRLQDDALNNVIYLGHTVKCQSFHDRKSLANALYLGRAPTQLPE